MSAELAAWFDEYRERATGRYRYHCEFCGRFVPFASIETSYSRWDGERRDFGDCIRHGRVEVIWGQQ